MMKNYTVTIIIILFSFTAVFGGTLPMRSYSVDEGLVSNEITACFQDSRGYIWFGTYNGLSRFDGKVFTNYKENTSTLGGSIIRDIKEDAQGNIWVAFTGGIARFVNGNKFVNYTPEDGLLGADVINLWPDPKQGVWVLSGEGVSYYEPNTDSFKSWTLDGIETGAFGSFLSGSPEGEVYAINKFGFNSKKPEDTEFTQLFQLEGTIISSLWHPVEKALYLLTPTKLFKRQEDELTEIAKSPLKNDLIDFHIGKNTIWAISETELWNVSTGRIYTGTELQEPALSRVMEDREGNLWLLTWAGAQRIVDYQIVLIDVPSKIITQIRKVNNLLWVAGDRGITCLDSSDNIQKQFDLPHIKDFYIDNNRIIAFPKNQIVIIDIETSEIIKTIESPENYTCAFRAKDGTLWVGSYQGLMIMKGDKPRMAEETATVWCFYENENGLWVGTENGLYNLKNDTWSQYTTEHGLTHNSVWHLAEHPEFGLLIATSSGISRQKSNGKFESFALPLLNINSLIIDKNQQIWAGTEKGVYRVNKNQESNFFIDRNRGLSSNSSCIKSVMISDEYAYFGTSKGLARIELSIKNDMTVSPLLDINRIELNGHTVSSLEQLEYTENNVSLYFNAVYAYLPDEIEFNYRLDGMDKVWKRSPVGQAVYTNLRPGSYTFKVQAFAEAGKQSPELSLSFEILPPFWLTKKGIIAEILSVLFLIFLLSGLMNMLQMRKQKRREAELAKMYEKVKFDHSVDTIKLYDRIEKLEMQNDSLKRKLNLPKKILET